MMVSPAGLALFASLLLLFFSNPISAHFQLTQPPSRGYMLNTANQTQCGGFNTAANAIQLSPNTNVTMVISSNHGIVEVYFAPGANFTGSKLITAFSVQAAPAMPNGINTGVIKWPPGIAAPETAGVLQFVYGEIDAEDNGMGNYYQCVDVISPVTSLGCGLRPELFYGGFVLLICIMVLAL